MFNMGRAIAIDLGSKYVKMVYGKRNKNGIAIIDAGLYEDPQPLNYNGMGDNVEYVKNAISHLIMGRNIKSRDLVIGIKGQDIITRHVEIPFMPEGQLQKAALLEIQQYLPLNSVEYIISSKKIKEVTIGNKKVVDMLVAAVPNKRVMNYYNAAKSLGLDLIRIDLFSNSMAKIFQYMDKGKTIALLDIGYAASNLILLEDGKFLMDREIGIGAKDIRESVDSASDMTAIESLGKQITRVFDFYSMNGVPRNVDILYLYGGGSMIEGVEEYIRRSVDVETQFFPGDTVVNTLKSHEKVENLIRIYLNCISLLM